MTPALYPAFFFRPPVHFQKHGNPPTKVGPIVVGKSHVILPFEEEGKGRCRGVLTFRRTVPARAGDGVSWATDATPAPFARHSGSHGQTGAELLEGSMTEKKWLFLCQWHIKIQQAAESPWPCNARFLSLLFGPRAAKVGVGVSPQNAFGCQWQAKRSACPAERQEISARILCRQHT